METNKKWPEGISVSPLVRGVYSKVYFNGEHIGFYYRASSNYPPSIKTVSTDHSIGCNNDKEAFEALIAAHRSKQFGINLSGSLFPDEKWILRINDISLKWDHNPSTKPRLVAKVSTNSHQATGSSAASKPVTNAIMSIDLETGKFFKSKKEQRFKNQKEMFKKLKAHFAKAMERKKR